ncbi:MAG: immunity 51 family protein [Clostridiales bacterium]|jgi:hypothetical protein|nr:immunity 51 family protein [Clostridiales bacterium]MDR2752002.1 immunity 51 family protein [Clostridiales bacterium]
MQTDTEEYAIASEYENTVYVNFYLEKDKPFAIGEKMTEINEEAYMNGSNWEAFFEYYLAENAPDILEGMCTDPEAGMYQAFYDLTPENKARAERFVEIIKSLINNEEELYRIIREEGDQIQWY